LAVVVVAAMVAMIAGSAIPAVADDNNNDGIFRFNGDRNDGFRFDRNNINDISDLGCLGAVIGGQCFGISTFDGIFLLDNNADFHNLNDRNDGDFFVG
jgi:hypothetical protein